jgi:ribosomal-protein-alanine N-acetyltransferase
MTYSDFIMPQDPRLLIRAMRPSDLDSIIRIEELSFPQPWSREQFTEEILRGSVSRCLVAIIDKGEGTGHETDPDHLVPVAGFVMAWLVSDELHITNLAVDPEKRRCGIGAALLERSMLDAVQEGAVWCQLDVRASNKPARSLYTRFGFKKLGVRKGYYTGGEDAVVMAKDLSD